MQVLDTVQNLPKFRPVTDPAEILRQNEIPITAQRLAVMRAVTTCPHSTAETIAEEVRSRIGTISRQAVYDALGMFAKKGLIRRIQPAGSPALFEDRVGDNHHHAICRSCGQTTDVDCALGATPCLDTSQQNGFQIDEAEVIYWGTCAACQSKSNHLIS